MRKRLLLTLLSLILCAIGCVVADRVAGLFIRPPARGLIFPPNATLRFRTREFSFTVETNSLGFRDREFGLQKRVRTRILALGDSFTYGWGVGIKESWPKVLERRLREASVDAEVANLGEPGGSPRTYADIAEKAVPLLKPDILIVAVLQGDDLAQMDLPPSPPTSLASVPINTSARHGLLRELAQRLFPNALALLDKRENLDIALSEQWKHDAATLLNVFTPAEKTRLEKIDARARDAFLNGELNPPMIYLSIHDPDYFSQVMDLNSPRVKGWVSQMAEQLMRIKNVAEQNHAQVLIVSMPNGIYTSAASLQSRHNLGFTTGSDMLISEAPDEEIGAAANGAGVQFQSFTRAFREAATVKEMFFEWDGHLNRAGHEGFAELLAPAIETRIRSSTGDPAVGK